MRPMFDAIEYEAINALIGAGGWIELSISQTPARPSWRMMELRNTEGDHYLEEIDFDEMVRLNSPDPVVMHDAISSLVQRFRAVVKEWNDPLRWLEVLPI